MNSSTRYVSPGFQSDRVTSLTKSQASSSKRIYRPRMISVDIDDTIADCNRRKEFALLAGPDRSVEFFEAFLDGTNYHLDTPIFASKEFLWRYVRDIRGVVKYVSGRRQGTEQDTLEWLTRHDFPNGEIIHRQKGFRSLNFKADWLLKFKRSKWVDAHFGDRLEDDGGAARYAGVKFVHIENLVWPEFEAIFPQLVKFKEPKDIVI